MNGFATVSESRTVTAHGIFNSDMFYANGEYHYVIGNLAVDKKTNESYIYDESGKRWYESELLYNFAKK